MHVAPLRSKNLNLIPILQALLQEQSVAGAAAAVCLSQPAVSGALARLREVLDDPLLVRVGHSMRLTPRAQRLRKQLDGVCAELEQLFIPEHFNPATAEDYFVVAAPDYLVFLLSHGLLTRLRKEAPGIRIRFVDVPTDLPNWMDASNIDLAVCGSFGIWPELKYEHLFRDRIVATVAKDHPLLSREQINSTDLLEFPSLNYGTSTAASKRDDRPVTGIPSLDWAPQVSVGQFSDAVLLATESPFVARAPASLVKRLSKLLPLATIDLAGEESEFDTGMFWAPVHEHSHAHNWLRMVVKEHFAAYVGARSPCASAPAESC
jgi:DNA-binding transcriptional LysR family regulator